MLEVNATVAGLGDERGLKLGLSGEGEDDLTLLALVALRDVEGEDGAVAVANVRVVLGAISSLRLVAADGNDQARLQVRVHVGKVTRAVSGAGWSSGRLLGRRNGLGDRFGDRCLRNGGGLRDRGGDLLGNRLGDRGLRNSSGLLNSGRLLNGSGLLDGGLLSDLLGDRRKSLGVLLSLSLSLLLSANCSRCNLFSLVHGSSLLFGLVYGSRDSLSLIDCRVLSRGLVNSCGDLLSLGLVGSVGVLLGLVNSLHLSLILSDGDSDIVLLSDGLHNGGGLALLSRDRDRNCSSSRSSRGRGRSG